METIISVLIGGGILTFVQFLLTRHDKKAEKEDVILKAIESLKKDLQTIKEEHAADRASNARTRILRFADEIRHGDHHSKEMFDQTLEDIDTYNRYCDGHPGYKNNRAVMAIESIRKVYARCLDENNFLE